METPFFPPWRARLGAMGRHFKSTRQQSLHQLETLFSDCLPAGLLSQCEEGANSRDRVYSLRRTFWGFLAQALNPRCSCREIVRQVQALFLLQGGGRVVDEGTGGYCQARARLPLDVLARARCAAAACAQKGAGLWRGLTPKVIDGTSTGLPDTLKNQRAYPQPSGQKPGCGFPLMKIVGVFCLSTGALLGHAKGNKHQHELALFQKLLDHFKPGDLALADRGFCSYALMALLLDRGVHSLFRLHGARPADMRQGSPLGKNDRLIIWFKPWDWQKPRFMPKSLWKLLPKELAVRILRFKVPVAGFRTKSITLVTTLLDPKEYPASELAALYARRWNIELWFRDIKTSMGMEVLRCKTPRMAHKELEMFFVAYNLIRWLMATTSAIHDVPIERLSFKGSADATRQFSAAIAQAPSVKKRKELVNQLLEAIARDRVPDRPGRREPRAVKRRPKRHPLLTKPRAKFKEIPHQSRYRKCTTPKSKPLI